MPDHTSPLGAKIGALLRIQEQLVALRNELAHLPPEDRRTVASELRAVADSLGAKEFVPDDSTRIRRVEVKSLSKESRANAAKTPSIRERMITFFVNRENKPASITEIEEALEVGSGVGTILYRRNVAGEFKRAAETRETGGNPAVTWQLSEATYRKARAPKSLVDDLLDEK